MGNASSAEGLVGIWSAALLAAWASPATGMASTQTLLAAHEVSLAAALSATLLEKHWTSPLYELTLGTAAFTALPAYVAYWPVPIISGFALRVFAAGQDTEWIV